MDSRRWQKNGSRAVRGHDRDQLNLTPEDANRRVFCALQRKSACLRRGCTHQCSCSARPGKIKKHQASWYGWPMPIHAGRVAHAWRPCPRCGGRLRANRRIPTGSVARRMQTLKASPVRVDARISRESPCKAMHTKPNTPASTLAATAKSRPGSGTAVITAMSKPRPRVPIRTRPGVIATANAGTRSATRDENPNKEQTTVAGLARGTVAAHGQRRPAA